MVRKKNMEKRNEILKSAYHMFCEKGYEEVFVREIADEVGISKATIIVIGFIMFSISLKFSGVSIKTFSIMGSMITTLSMIFIGVVLAEKYELNISLIFKYFIFQL